MNKIETAIELILITILIYGFLLKPDSYLTYRLKDTIPVLIIFILIIPILKLKNNKQKQRQEQLNKMKYYEYLQTPEWQEKRKTALEKAGYICEKDNCKERATQVHHLIYNRGNEKPEELIALCKYHHLQLELEKEAVLKNINTRKNQITRDETKWAE